MAFEKFIEQFRQLPVKDRAKLLERLQSEVKEGAFKRAAGAWSDIDDEALVKEIHNSL